MARSESARLNIRSQFARDRAVALTRLTGMTITQVVEEALRAYDPPPLHAAPPSELVWERKISVKPTKVDK